MGIDPYSKVVEVAASQDAIDIGEQSGSTEIVFEHDRGMAAQVLICNQVDDETLEYMRNYMQAQHGALQRMNVTFVAGAGSSAEVRVWQSEQVQDSQGKPVVRWVEVEDA